MVDLMLNSTTQFGYGFTLCMGPRRASGATDSSYSHVLAADALAANGKVHFGAAVIIGLVASMVADAGWYEAGRYRGMSWIHSLCRFSLEKDSCARKTRRLYGTYGAFALVIAKFVPGLNFAAPSNKQQPFRHRN
jgi:membrane protein DedA with SNARE-associated domain